MIKSNSSGLILSIHDDFPVRDFPHWFETFFNEQLIAIECNADYFSAMPLPHLQMTYIKLWSVIESFSKIACLLAEKRHCLKDISPEIKRIEGVQIQLEQYKSDVLAAMSFYQMSIDANSALNADALKAITAVKGDFKRRELKKYSVEKSVVFKEKLPNKTVMDKALSTLKLNVAGFSEVLNDDSKNSIYYQTRNRIAHEGKSDISETTLINKRIMPLLKVIEQIKACLERSNEVEISTPAVSAQTDLNKEVAQ